MISTNTIIVATNFSSTANNAVSYAAQLAKASGAKLILFNSFSLNPHSAHSLITADAMQKQLEATTNKLEAKGAELANQYALTVSCFCNYSFVDEQLAYLIDETKAGLVVMGMARRSFEQELIGNSTTNVIKNIDIPVLAIPENAKFKENSKILYACDVLSLSAMKKFDWLRNLVGTIGGEIEIFSVEKTLDQLKQKNEEILSNASFNEDFKAVKYVYKAVKSNTVIEAIHQEIEHYNADILVMVPRKYGFWDSLVHKSKTRIMAAGLNIPLLSLPNF